MAEPISVAQLITQDNLGQLRQARQNIGAASVVPTGSTLKTASNPIGMITAGLQGMGNALAAPGQREAQQANLERANALQQEQTAYSRGIDAAEMASRESQLKQAQSNADRQFNAAQDQLDVVNRQKDRSFAADEKQRGVLNSRANRAEQRGIDQFKAGQMLKDAVAGYGASIDANAALVRDGSEEALPYQALKEKQTALLASLRKFNDQNDNPYDNVDVEGLTVELQNKLDSKFKLDTVNQNEYDGFAAARTKQMQDLQATSLAEIQGQMTPVDPILSSLEELKINGQVGNGVEYAIENMTIPEGTSEERISSAKEIVKIFKKNNPDFKKSNYQEQIIASAVMQSPLLTGYLDDNNDYTASGSRLTAAGSQLERDLKEKWDRFKLAELNNNKNNELKAAHVSRMNELQTENNRQMAAKIKALQLKQGILVNAPEKADGTTSNQITKAISALSTAFGIK